MSGFSDFFKRHFRADGAEVECADGDNGAFSAKKLFVIVALWMALWTIWPSLCIGNVSIDIAENVAWGQNFAWGYDKNPYFGAWLSYAVFRLLPISVAEYFFYFMSQLSAMTGLIAVYWLARDIFKREFPAFLLVPLAFLIPFFGHSACEFNDDVLCMSLYGLTALFFYRGVRRNTPGMWIAAGLCAGLALMTKYLSGVLLLPLGMLLILTREGRACWKKPWIYLGGAVCLLLVIPNVIWLFQHDFVAVQYALRRAELDEPSAGILTRLRLFFDVWGDFLSRLILPVLALLIFRRGAPAVRSGFDRAVVWATLTPTVLSSLFALVTGGRVMVSWTTPYYVFVTLWMVMLYRPLPERRNIRIFIGFMALATVIMILIFGYEFAYRRPYLRRHYGYNTYPGRRVADHLTAEWRPATPPPAPTSSPTARTAATCAITRRIIRWRFSITTCG